MHVIEMDVRAGGLERSGLRRFGDGVLRGEQFKDPFAGGARLGELVVQAREIFHRRVHEKNAQITWTKSLVLGRAWVR